MSHYDEFRTDREWKCHTKVVEDSDTFNTLFLGTDKSRSYSEGKPTTIRAEQCVLDKENHRDVVLRSFLESATDRVFLGVDKNTATYARTSCDVPRKDYMYTPLMYVKKPVHVEALMFVYSDEGVAALKTFVGGSLGTITKSRHNDAKAEAHIYTLEDGVKQEVRHVATEGDFIIKGVEGEFYPCKPDIFWKTYSVSDVTDTTGKSVNATAEAL